MKRKEIYLYGCMVTFCLYFMHHAPLMEGYKEGFVLACFSLVVSITSWAYPIARIIEKITS